MKITQGKQQLCCLLLWSQGAPLSECWGVTAGVEVSRTPTGASLRDLAGRWPRRPQVPVLSPIVGLSGVV